MLRSRLLIRLQETRVVNRGGGVRTQRLVTTSRGARQFLTGITEFDVGASLPLHSHNCEESVVVLEGEATFETDATSYEMQAFDSTLVPSGVVHRFINGGDQQLLILWIYGSISATRTLAATGETFQIGSSRERVTDASRTTTSNGRAGSRKRERQRLRSS